MSRFAAIELALAIIVLLPQSLFAANITGTVKDPSGAVISDARIEITGQETSCSR